MSRNRASRDWLVVREVLERRVVEEQSQCVCKRSSFDQRRCRQHRYLCRL